MKGDLQQYWRFALRIRRGSGSHLRWSYLTPAAAESGPRIPRDRRVVTVALLRGDGRETLDAIDVPVTEVLDGDPRLVSVTGQVPFHPLTRRVEIRFEGSRVAALDVPDSVPVIAIDGDSLDLSGVSILRWQILPAVSNGLWYSVYFECGNRRRIPLAGKIREQQLKIDSAKLPGCDSGRLVVRVSNGFQTTEASTAPFSLPPRPPRVDILWPKRGTRLVTSRNWIQARGQAWDVQESELVPPEQLSWRLDGRTVATGELCVLRRVPPGAHALELHATDAGGRTANARMTLAVSLAGDDPRRRTVVTS